MVLSNEKINELIELGAKEGKPVRVRDISYVLLSSCYEDKEVAYKSLFGASSDGFEEYKSSTVVKFLESKLNKKESKKAKGEDITFEENKAEIIKLIKETQDALEKGTIEPKDALKIQADLRVKLNDKFSVNETVQEQLVIVNCKYNSVCECGRELYIPTKEDLMKEYNLIEKQ